MSNQELLYVTTLPDGSILYIQETDNNGPLISVRCLDECPEYYVRSTDNVVVQTSEGITYSEPLGEGDRYFRKVDDTVEKPLTRAQKEIQPLSTPAPVTNEPIEVLERRIGIKKTKEGILRRIVINLSTRLFS